MMVVSVETEPILDLGKPELVFQGNYVRGVDIPNYDIHPDGEHLLMVKGDIADVNQINIVLNWFEELKEKFRYERE